MRRSSKFYSDMGKKGAEIFWNKFNNDPKFQEKMRKSWKGHKVNPEKIVEAAKLGYAAFRKRYEAMWTSKDKWTRNSLSADQEAEASP